MAIPYSACQFQIFVTMIVVKVVNFVKKKKKGNKVDFCIKTIGKPNFLFSTKTMTVFLWIFVSAPKKPIFII